MIVMCEAVPILKAQGYLIALMMTRISFKFQVTIFSKSYAQSVALCEEVKAAMSGKALQLMHIEDYENDTQLFSQKLDYQLSF